MNGEDWLNKNFDADDSEALIGTAQNAIVRPHTKNLVEAPEKAFKTTFLLRLSLGLSTGKTVFPSLPVTRAKRVLYLHGELALPEIQDRLRGAAQELPRPLETFLQGRSLDASLVTEEGRETVRNLTEQFSPEVLVIDPWQSFIAGIDENNFKEVSGATAFLDKLIGDLDLTLFLVAHQGKDRSKGARGHSSLAGWRDTRFSIKKNTKGLFVNVEPRWAHPLEDLKFTFRNGTVWEGEGPCFTDQQLQMRELLKSRGGTMSRAELGEAMHLDGSALRTALKRATDNGAVAPSREQVFLPEDTMSIKASPHPPI